MSFEWVNLEEREIEKTLTRSIKYLSSVRTKRKWLIKDTYNCQLVTCLASSDVEPCCYAKRSITGIIFTRIGTLSAHVRICKRNFKRRINQLVWIHIVRALRSFLNEVSYLFFLFSESRHDKSQQLSLFIMWVSLPWFISSRKPHTPLASRNLKEIFRFRDVKGEMFVNFKPCNEHSLWRVEMSHVFFLTWSLCQRHNLQFWFLHTFFSITSATINLSLCFLFKLAEKPTATRNLWWV